MFSDKVLLYPQTFLYPSKLHKAFEYFSQIFLLKLPVSDRRFNFWERNQLLPKIKYLKIKKLSKKEEEVLEKEVRLLQEWGLNFRTPETLKYLMQFKKVTEDSLEEYLSIFKRNQEIDENFEEVLRIKRALIILSLAEELDFFLYEVENSLKEVEAKLSEFFQEKIIGEDETFEKILFGRHPKEEFIFSENLFNLNLRVFSWKILLPHLNWDEVPFPKALLVTEKVLIENWQEMAGTLEEISLNSDIIFFRFNKPLKQLLDIPETFSFSFPNETQVFLLK